MFWTELMEKLGTKFVQKRVPGEPPKVILVGNQKTYGDLEDSGTVKFKYPSTSAAMSDVPFYFSDFDQASKKIVMPPLDEVVGEERARQLLDNIQAHKEWINQNDARVTFVPTLGVISSNPDTKLVAVNALSPAAIHHELGHLNSSTNPYWFRYLRNRANLLGPAISAIAFATKKLSGSQNPLLTAAQYGGAAVPVLGQLALEMEERKASNNAMDFIRGHYSPEEAEASQAKLDAALYTYQKKMRRALGASTATAAALILANKKFM